ncbi:MAG TPA: hypothetical protein VL832_14125 [Puia sp.]|nr:hypothetical protein [Puia sp.]
MNNFTLQLWDNEASKCTFYTVRREDALESETDKFFNKYNAIPGLKKATQVLLSFVLDSIGEDHGAIDGLFNRFENEVVGLPNKGRVTVGEIVFLYPDFPLRLYALRINNRHDLVVLFNGGLKSAATNQGSKNLYLKWIEACQFARRIEEALRDNEIIIDHKNRRILSHNGEEEIYL